MPESIEKTETKRAKQGRSPAYPNLSIEEALEKAQALHDAEGTYAVPMPSAFAAWGYGTKSSGGRATRAALRYYGLISIEGDREAGKVQLTEDARRVLLDNREDQSEKKALVKKMALAPAIHEKLVEKFPQGIKSDATVEHYLVFEEGYNQKAAGEIIKEFKATAHYAGLFEPADIVGKACGNEAEKAAIGDLVQWELDGVLKLEAAKRVRAIQTHDGAEWVFVDGSETGIPIDQVLVEAKGGQQAPAGSGKAPILPLSLDDPPKEEWHEERLIDDGGEEIFIRYEGQPSVARYEYIRDYLSFKIERLKKQASKPSE
jgi:hypothetical protein